MKLDHRYVVGGYSGDQLGPLVDAMLRDADAATGGRDRLREVVRALSVRLKPECPCGLSAEPWHVYGICNEGPKQTLSLLPPRAEGGAPTSPPLHAFVGGYTVDPTQPADCQICGRHVSEHVGGAAPTSPPLDEVNAWRKRADEAERLAADLFRVYVDHSPSCLSDQPVPRNFTDERCTCGLKVIAEHNPSILALAFMRTRRKA